MSRTEHHDHDEVKKDIQRDERYWLSLEEWAKDPEFQKNVENEFTSTPILEGAQASKEEGWARREFLKLMGASMAMASAGCIRRPVQTIVPYAKQPEDVIYGVSNFYTSTWSDGLQTYGLLVKTREGRPLKIEGNPRNPLNKGALSVRANAHILSLYDPERLKGPRHNLLNKEKTNFDSISANYEDMDKAIVKQLKKGGVATLTGHISSPSLRSLISEFSQGFKAKNYSWEPVSAADIRDGQKESYGEAVVPFYRFDKADLIVSIDADFLGTWLNPTTFTRQFSSGRQNPKSMNQLVSFESLYSLTGANADIRHRIKPSQQLDVVMGLLHEIVVNKGRGSASYKEVLAPFAGTAARLGIDEVAFKKLAADLIANAGKSLVVAGGLVAQTAQSLQLQVAVNYLNSILGNDGVTVDYKQNIAAATGSYADLTALIAALNKGEIKTVIIHGVNPVYATPSSLGLREALRKAEMVIYTGDRIDETGRLADYIIPDHHPLESWGDTEFVGGLYGIHQPTIRPMYDTRSFQLSLMNWAFYGEVGPKRIRDFEAFYDYLRNFWKEEFHGRYGAGKSFETFWQDALQSGLIGDLGTPGSARSFRGQLSGKPSSAQGYELVLYPSIALYDGTLANVSWLQELPDPISKICWDNYASLSIGTAEALKLKEGDVVELTVNGKKVSLPTHIQPGLHDDVIAVAVGYGRTDAGKVANGVGINAYELVSVVDGKAVYSGLTTEIKKTGKNITLANPQGHHAMEGRKIVAEATLTEFLKDPHAGNHRHKVFSIWPHHKYNGHKWGMSVDLNLCTGCSACTIACQSENNIPVVGKKYVIQGREMAWIRVDRYYVGDPKNAEVVFQPVMCQHCDNAPCESVCPVAATTHSDEGTNDMAYNRCVGTRYCANNCPYKVRRFNWFNWQKDVPQTQTLAYNPDVTVRMRGVMEKCSFCVHRIKEGKNEAKLEKRELKDGDIKTACEQSCPTNAITFGDLNDKNSRVAKAFNEDPRNYPLLEEFNAAPAVRYMVKIRNNNQDTRNADAHQGGHS